MTFPDRSDPDWTFDDSWQEDERLAQEEPLAFVTCPCCGGHGHEVPAAWGGGGLYCTGRIDRIKRDLREYVRTGKCPPSPDDAVDCLRCGDTGVVPREDA